MACEFQGKSQNHPSALSATVKDRTWYCHTPHTRVHFWTMLLIQTLLYRGIYSKLSLWMQLTAKVSSTLLVLCIIPILNNEYKLASLNHRLLTYLYRCCLGNLSEDHNATLMTRSHLFTLLINLYHGGSWKQFLGEKKRVLCRSDK